MNGCNTKKRLFIDPPEEWQVGVVTLFATKYPERQIKSCAEGTQPSNVFFLSKKVCVSSNSTISQNGKTMLFFGGDEIRQPPTCLFTTYNFITIFTTTETFQAGHLATISGEKYHRQVKLYRENRQDGQDVLSGQRG